MQSQKKLLTIIMPVFNAEKYIEEVLQNIAGQSFGDYELLIMDSMSTDNTKAIIQAKQLADERIILVSEKDNGIYDAMNKGIQLARGEWLYFIGSDDTFFDAEVLQTFSLHLIAGNDLVYGDVLWIPDHVLESGECTPQHLLHRNINHQRIFYRKAVFLQYGAYDLQYTVASDHELNIRFFCAKTVTKKYVPLTVARYHSGGFSANKTDKVFWNNWKQIFQQNFSTYMPNRMMYEKLGWYCRYNIDQHNYRIAFVLFWDVLLHTFNPGFALLTLQQLVKSFRSSPN